MKKKHWSFWLVCIAGLVWNVGGSANYLMQTSIEFVNSMPATHQAIIIGRPAWATAGFAVGVFGGVLACVLLMFVHRTSITVFLVSLVGIIVTMIHTMNVVMSEVEFSFPEVFFMAILPLAVALALFGYAKHAISKYGVR
ncbi:hypothetical protein AB833_27760 [Chromatiales bacterium (ex Bugula neritina AB1)]|nr:hypothetical protein AB833_27760 [Chromatiales bacterium (ex Bugula neritina AB1)]